ncbi:MAG: glycosyltransferase, partial [Planctomycetota bacterium]
MTTNDPRVSVVIVSHNGRAYLKDCLDAVHDLDYPKDRLDVFLIDNGSTDGTEAFVRQWYPRVQVIVKKKNEGYARPNNEVARLAQGEVLAFLNNDIRVERGWLRALVETMAREEAACAGSLILSWDGKRIDFAGGEFTMTGKGLQPDFGVAVGEADVGEDPRETLFVCSGAMTVLRDAFLEAGGFDEDMGWYYVDVDLGIRLRMAGKKVTFVPQAKAFHVHGGTVKAFPERAKRFLLERNALRILLKSLEEENLFRALTASTLSLVDQVLREAGVQPSAFDLRNPDPPKAIPLTEEAGCRLGALQSLLEDLDPLWERRQEVQSRRKRSDAEWLGGLSPRWDPAGGESPALPFSAERHLFRIAGLGRLTGPEAKRKRIVLVCDFPVGRRMGGPGIRYWEFARHLKDEFDVTLAAPEGSEVNLPGVTFLPLHEDQNPFRNPLPKADLFIVFGFRTFSFPFSLRLGAPIVFDLHCPFPLENLHYYRSQGWAPYARDQMVQRDLNVLRNQLHRGDFFLCASPRQRDLLLGWLSLADRVNVATFDEDETLSARMACVPFGLPGRDPVHGRRVLKGVHPAVGEEDFVILWGGGVFDWLDPVTAVKAMKRVREHRPDVRLVFLGTQNPHPGILPSRRLADAVQAAREEGLLDREVLFNEGYVDYDERENWLLESDAGIVLHPDTLETRFAFRTRVLDYLWAGLPILISEGDTFAERVESEGLGIAVGVGDSEGLARAILRLAGDESFRRRVRENIGSVRETMTWERAIEPLRAFCRA